MRHFYLTITSRKLLKSIDNFYQALCSSFEKEKTPEDPTLKRYEVHERLIARGLNHPATQKEVKELIAQGFLPEEGLGVNAQQR